MIKYSLLFRALHLSFNLFTEQKIKEAQEKISGCKNELQQAKRVRKHRQGLFHLPFSKPAER